MPLLEVVVRNPDNQEVDLATLTDDQREALMSDIDEQLRQQEIEDFRIDYKGQRTGPASAGGVAVFTVNAADGEVANQLTSAVLQPIEDFAGEFNGVTHTAVIRARATGGRKSRKLRKTRKGKAKKTRKVPLRFSY